MVDFIERKAKNDTALHLLAEKIVGGSSVLFITGAGTQNIDRLHPFTLNVRLERLAEVHGRLGLYKCITPDCKYSYEESLTEQDVDLNALAVEGTSMEKGNLQLKKAPVCISCGEPVLPQSLLFDELYESHSHYSWEKAQLWMEDSDIYIFVGTSFSVGVTAEAIAIAEKEKKMVFNFNLTEDNFNCEMYNIIGKAEETLPRLYNFMLIHAGKPRMYFYPLSNENKTYGMPPRLLPFANSSSSLKRPKISS